MKVRMHASTMKLSYGLNMTAKFKTQISKDGTEGAVFSTSDVKQMFLGRKGFATPFLWLSLQLRGGVNFNIQAETHSA